MTTADKIIWTFASKKGEDEKITLDVISSGYWLDSLAEIDSYDSSAYEDDE
jgi:hypothetical protein